MKKVFFIIMFIIWGIVTNINADELYPELFIESAEFSKLDSVQVDKTIVLRQRPITIRFDLLKDENVISVILNLFEGTDYTVVLEKMAYAVAGGFIWNGIVEGHENSMVNIVENQTNLSGTVKTGDACYQIRPMEENLHVIREIDASFCTQPAAFKEFSIEAQAHSSMETDVIELMNLERSVYGLHPLQPDDQLLSAARGHSLDMAENNDFNHISLDGRNFSDRITEAGYIPSAAGENIAAGYPTAESVMDGWMNSSGHRSNILNATYCDIGVGYAYNEASDYGRYWTQDFGRRVGVDSCLSPVSVPPVIDSFFADPTEGAAPSTVTFQCTAHDNDGSIESYTIDFGDGTPVQVSEGNVFTHTYLNKGFYQAYITVADNSDNETTSDYVTIDMDFLKGDFDLDGDVDGSDLSIFFQNFGRN